MIRTVIVVVLLALYTLVLGVPVIVYSWLAGSVDLLYRAGVAGVIFLLRAVGMKVRVEGVENIPPGACVFVANHASYVDPPAVVRAIPRRIAILAKKSLFRLPVVGWAFRLARFVPVDRANREAAIGSVDQAVRALREGTSFLIYPEGTRSADGRLKPFKKGAAVMAIKAGVPLVPVSVTGAHRIMGRGKIALHPGEVVVRFGAPIEPYSYTFEQRDELTARVQAAVAAGLPSDQQPNP